MRKAQISRVTGETDITVGINLDGTGEKEIDTGIGFFDHMLDQIARHGMIDLSIKAKGDLEVDGHHTVGHALRHELCAPGRGALARGP